MVSSETLRPYAEFGTLSDAQLKSISTITTEVRLKKGEIVFEEGKPAVAMFLLVDGTVDLSYVIEETLYKVNKEFSVGEISAGELFGLSALFEPYRYETMAKAAQESTVLRIDGLDLRKLCEKDRELGFLLMKQLVKIINHKLQATRAKLAATRTVS